jgi:aspartyl-tRNA(Asn)/glutamyl-tRNA(Gln) amidotransferase subunit A
MSEDLAFVSATDLVELYRAGTVSPVEVTRAVLDRIDRTQATLNAYVLVDHEGALEAARESEGRWRMGEPRGLIDGVPTSVKDLVLTKGWPTLKGSLTVDPDQPWEEDAPAVARLREHGAVLLGKTTTPEFGHKGVTESRVTGITSNPWNPNMTPGGSSGGASAALAAGLGQLAIGTDGGGSIRIPSSFAGVFGLKPTYARVPAYPLSPFGTVAHLGPMARTVADAALMLTVLAEPDWRDWHALPYDGADYRESLDEPLDDLRIAYSPTLGLGEVPLEPEVRALVDAAARTFETTGASVEEADPVWPHDPARVFLVYWNIGSAKLVADLSDEQRAKLDPSLLTFAEAGRRYSGLDIKDAELARAACGLALAEFFERYDLLLSPTMPMPAFEVGRDYPSEAFADEPLGWTPYTYPINLTKNPAASVPCGFTGSGLPVGLQVIGPLYGEAAVLRACRAYEKANPLHEKRPEVGHGRQ